MVWIKKNKKWMRSMSILLSSIKGLLMGMLTLRGNYCWYLRLFVEFNVQLSENSDGNIGSHYLFFFFFLDNSEPFIRWPTVKKETNKPKGQQPSLQNSKTTDITRKQLGNSQKTKSIPNTNPKLNSNISSFYPNNTNTSVTTENSI